MSVNACDHHQEVKFIKGEICDFFHFNGGAEFCGVKIKMCMC